jgi:hypothetical protein
MNKNFEKLMAMVEGLTNEEKAQFRAALGIKDQVVKSAGVRVGGKVQRTDKVLETKIAKQMEILINCLPTDKAVDINEWADLAVAAGLQTQQPAVRIAAYYKKPIIDGGYATVIG